MADTYAISIWDHEEDGWQPEVTGLTKWQIRPALRQLYAFGWSQISLRVEAETHQRPAARFARKGRHAFMASTSVPKSVRRKLMGSDRRKAGAP